MNKQTAISLLGGTPTKAAKAMGYDSPQAVSAWPEQPSLGVVDRIVGALCRKHNYKLPKDVVTQIKANA